MELKVREMLGVGFNLILGGVFNLVCSMQERKTACILNKYNSILK